MTGKDLFDQMLAIGGKTQWVGHEGAARFEAVNRAVFEVNRLFPVTQKIQLVNYPLVPVEYHGGIRVHKGGEVIRIDASGVKSLAFAVSGGGGRAVLYGVTVDKKGEECLEKIEGFEWEPLTSFEVKRCVVPSSVGEPTPSPEGEGKSGGASPSPTEQADDLISELRALGYVGNDLAALTADMKKKREAQAAQDAKREAAATKAAGKNHIRSGKPGKSASGDGTGGVTERQVEHFVSLTKESRESARQRLTRHARLIEGK